MAPIIIASIIIFGGIAAVFLIDLYVDHKTAKQQRRLLDEKNAFYDNICKAHTDTLLIVLKDLNDKLQWWCIQEIKKELKRREVNV